MVLAFGLVTTWGAYTLNAHVLFTGKLQMIDFDIVKKTELRQKGELDKLFGVSRIMVNAYLSGDSYPRGRNRKKITAVVSILEKLLNKGKLPLSPDRDRDSRQAAVEKIQAFVDTAGPF